MTSHYLTEAAEANRKAKLVERIAAEALPLPGGRTWKPESDFWKLPRKLRDEISFFVSGA